MLRGIGLSVLALVTAAACGNSRGGSVAGTWDGGVGDATASWNGGDSGGGSGSSNGGDSGIDGGPTPFDPSVYQHHRSGTRDGLYIDSVFTQTAAANTHVLSSFIGMVTTYVYAQPLYVENGPGGAEVFVVATEDNHVTTYNAITGATIWDVGPTVIGDPVTTNLPGGAGYTGPAKNPLSGITGTPYIDIASRTIFFDAMTTPDNNKTFHHKVFAVSLDTGAVLTNWPVDVNTAVKGFDSGVQSERGALQFLNGVLYVPYGGFAGDAGNYHGWVIGFPLASPHAPTGWHTAGLKGGIWGPGALPTDGVSIFPVTGNTALTGGTWGGGEAVIRLAPGPAFSGNSADYYTPSTWLELDNTDRDLGGASEVILDMPGAAYPHLIVAAGKDANMYVLNRDNLGGIGGELLTVQVGEAEVKGAPAAYTTALGTYVAFHIDGDTGKHCPSGEFGNLVVVKLTQSATAVTAKTVWCSTQRDLGSPIVTTTDGTSNPIVWDADDKLYGWNGDTGAVIVDGTNTAMSTAVQKWNTPINAKGRIVVGVSGQLYVFTPSQADGG